MFRGCKWFCAAEYPVAVSLDGDGSAAVAFPAPDKALMDGCLGTLLSLAGGLAAEVVVDGASPEGVLEGLLPICGGGRSERRVS